MPSKRDYIADVFDLKAARTEALRAAPHLRRSGATRAKRAFAAFLKSLDGAIRNAEGHASRNTQGATNVSGS